MRSIKEMVKDNRKARFVFFRDGALHYETEDGFVFPVPVSDAGSATFGAEERAILLMRYIRKYLAVVETARQDETHGG
jgi:hypothetical protein